MPSGCAYIHRAVIRFRASLESAILAAGGEVGLMEAAIIQTATRWERHALLAQRWLRLEAGSMTATERLAYSRDAATASANRDRCLKELGLRPVRPEDPWDSFYRQQRARLPAQGVAEAEDGPAASEAAEAAPRAAQTREMASEGDA